MTQTQDQSIQKFARGTKTTLQITFAAVAVLMAGTAIYAAAKGVALSSTFLAYLANPWAIAIIVSVATIYLIAASCQQWHSIEGTPGKDGEDANFSVLLSDAVKGAKIVEKGVTKDGQEVKELCLELSSDNSRALLGEKTERELHVIFKGDDGRYTSEKLDCKVEGDKITVTGFNFAEMKKALGVDEKAASLKVAVSDKDPEALKGDVSAKLADVAIEGAVKKAIA
ncbi:MAG: hypothetical protein LKM45_01495 [Wolbachia endosymbiont of Alcedoecus sp.]|nr:hypothetical protein [Wolbachia endosymbiont of Alcedoecus sp.]